MFSLTDIQSLYLEFLNNFPPNLRPIISIVVAVMIVYSILKVLKKDWIYLIALVVLLPAARPILQTAWQWIVILIKFLLNIK